MESQCDYSMYFPAVPFPPRELLAGESSGYRALPRRNHLYLGETVRFLLVLRRNTGNADRNTGNTGNADRNTGNADRNTGNAERNAERNTGNAERNTGNADRNTGNAERNTGNADRNTGNAERNTGNVDRNTGNAERAPGNTERIPVNPERIPANSDGIPANSDGISANSDGIPANSDGIPANSDGIPAKPEGMPAHSTASSAHSTASSAHSSADSAHSGINPAHSSTNPAHSAPNPAHSAPNPAHSASNPAHSAPSPAPSSPWAQLAASLSALATVTSGDTRTRDEDEEEEENPGNFGNGPEDSREPPLFRECRALLTHARGPPGGAGAGLPVDDPIISQDEVIFPLTVALDRLPPGTAKAKIVVTVWQRDTEPPELQEGTGTGPGPGQVTMTGTGTGTGPGGYLRLLQGRAPGQVFRQQHGAFKAQVSTLLTVLPPPRVRCRQVTVSGKYLTVLKVLNGSSQEELSLWDVQVLPNFNASYLPVMPDGSVLLVDDVCHHSGEVPVGAFCRVPGCHSGWPCPLSALEEQNFLFQLQAPERPPRDAKEGLEVPLVAVVRWSTPKLPFTNSIVTHYRLPSIRLERPRFVMTATCESPVVALQRFTVTYTLLNDLQDFLAVRLVWTPEATAGRSRGSLDSVVCHTPLTNLGYSRKGSARTFRVAFQALRAGLFELSQHMKLKLQFTASVSSAPAEARPVSRRGSPGSPAVRELVAGLGRSQSFSHQQPARSHLIRSGSVMERRAITPPVGSPVGRPLYLPAGDKAVLALDKIAKRECKVLVVPPLR
ncbi:trafficking protein particle complex subunit 14 isoform X2 [Taeniopygia guttata]|uniref:trafficking protein particle complex subunit 14 isoform X2 n=1 Tax=Taeniopygia guttata TaxID=59729 RepID=UPI003BB98ACC